MCIRDRVKEIKENCPVPIIAKEVGFGFSRESIERIYQSGVSIFDIGGQGGTNFVTIEDQRQGMFGSELDQWGIPTAVSLIAVSYTHLYAYYYGQSCWFLCRSKKGL